jgi:hypothetical protein
LLNFVSNNRDLAEIKSTKMKRNLVVVVMLIISHAGICQNETQTKPNPLSPRLQRLTNCRQQIVTLKSNALIVRLPTKKKSVEALRKAGKDKQADKLIRETVENNQMIVDAFKSGFDFCPVYFMSSDYSEQLLSGHFDSIVFLNDKMQPDANIKFSKPAFLLAEFGLTQQDTTKHMDGYTLVHTSEGAKREPVYYGSSEMGIDALIIKSQQFVQLVHPFPYYVRTLGSLPLHLSFAKTVVRMNKKLGRYYKHVA